MQLITTSYQKWPVTMAVIATMILTVFISWLTQNTALRGFYVLMPMMALISYSFYISDINIDQPDDHPKLEMCNYKFDILDGVMYGCEVRIDDYDTFYKENEAVDVYTALGTRTVYIQEIKHYKSMQNAIRYGGQFIASELHDRSKWAQLLDEDYDTDIDHYINKYGVQMIHWTCRARTW